MKQNVYEKVSVWYH